MFRAWAREREALALDFGLAFWPVGVVFGLILAWFREGLGGLITTGCLIAFYLWNVILEGSPPTGPFFFLVAAPGVLFLLVWLWSGRKHVPM